MKVLKILHTVEFYYPSVGGAQEVVKQLSEHLAMLGHDVTVATTKLSDRKTKVINGVKVVEFEVSGNEVRGFTGKDIIKYQEYLVNQKFDVVMNYAAQEWAADLAFPVLDKIKGKKIFVPCGYSGLYDPAYKAYFEKLPEILKNYDKAVYLSNDYRDINFAKKNNLKNSIVIPNGADEREFGVIPAVNKSEFIKKYGIPIDNQILLCVGNHTGQKGHSEAIKAFRRMGVKNISLVIIGGQDYNKGCYGSCTRSSQITNLVNIFSRSNKTIHILQLNREDTLKFYAISNLFLFLSNIECSPLVLFESAAAGKPFIASSCGNAAEIAKWTKSGVITKAQQKANGYTTTDIGEAALSIENMLMDKNVCDTLGECGRHNWEKKFTWKVIANEYLRVYQGNT